MLGGKRNQLLCPFLRGLFLSSHNQVTVQVLNNTFTNNIGLGMSATAAADAGASDNSLDALIRHNTITGNSNPSGAAGIAVEGGLFDASDNQTTAGLLDNTIMGNNGAAIITLAGLANSSHNQADVKIRGNTLENNAGVGIAAIGGCGAGGNSSGNTLDARIERNSVKNAFVFGLWTTGGIGSFAGALTEVANANQVNAIVTDHTITGTFGEGMHLDAGGSGVANDNEVEITLRKNTVCGSASADIHAIGGLLGSPFFPDNAGTGNTLEGAIVKNTASTVVVENGVAGNLATMSRSHNVPCP